MSTEEQKYVIGDYIYFGNIVPAGNRIGICFDDVEPTNEDIRRSAKILIEAEKRKCLPKVLPTYALRSKLLHDLVCLTIFKQGGTDNFESRYTLSDDVLATIKPKICLKKALIALDKTKAQGIMHYMAEERKKFETKNTE